MVIYHIKHLMVIYGNICILAIHIREINSSLEAIVNDCNCGVIRVAASVATTVLEGGIGHVSAVPSALYAVVDEKLQHYILA